MPLENDPLCSSPTPARSTSEREVEKKSQLDQEADLGIMFSMFNHDNDDFITAVELEESFRWLSTAMSVDKAVTMVAHVNANRDGLIDIHEFIWCM
jgi:Ca2+-binding EF-hand superfamily protein